MSGRHRKTVATIDIFLVYYFVGLLLEEGLALARVAPWIAVLWNPVYVLFYAILSYRKLPFQSLFLSFHKQFFLALFFLALIIASVRSFLEFRKHNRRLSRKQLISLALIHFTDLWVLPGLILPAIAFRVLLIHICHRRTRYWRLLTHSFLLDSVVFRYMEGIKLFFVSAHFLLRIGI